MKDIDRDRKYIKHFISNCNKMWDEYEKRLLNLDHVSLSEIYDLKIKYRSLCDDIFMRHLGIYYESIDDLVEGTRIPEKEIAIGFFQEAFEIKSMISKIESILSEDDSDDDRQFTPRKMKKWLQDRAVTNEKSSEILEINRRENNESM